MCVLSTAGVIELLSIEEIQLLLSFQSSPCELKIYTPAVYSLVSVVDLLDWWEGVGHAQRLASQDSTASNISTH